MVARLTEELAQILDSWIDTGRQSAGPCIFVGRARMAPSPAGDSAGTSIRLVADRDREAVLYLE